MSGSLKILKLIKKVEEKVEPISEIRSVFDVPLSGKCTIKKIYVDPDAGKLVIEYESTPVG